MLFGLPSWEDLLNSLFFKVGWLVFWGSWVLYWLRSIYLDSKRKRRK